MPEAKKYPVFNKEKAIEKIKFSSEFPLAKMEIPASLKDPQTFQHLGSYNFIYAVLGLVLGLVCIIGGIVLFLNGVAGSTSWTAKILGAESNISDAAPGVVLFIVGLFVVYVTRFDVKVKNDKK